MNENNGGGDAPSLREGFRFVYMHVFWSRSGLLLPFVVKEM
jgi:hypothetical protein